MGDRLVYAVGDIHGRCDLLDAALLQIGEDAAVRAAASRPTVVFLGDYVDRGPQSRQVIQRLLEIKAANVLELRFLRGNHEQCLLNFLDDPLAGPFWIEHGGAPTLASYGVAVPRVRADRSVWEAARDSLMEMMPADHLAFIKAAELSAAYGDYWFVHAGVRPGVPLEEQRERDALWIRRDFLDAEGPFEKVVVHGHTPEPVAFLGEHRIGLDTGAYATGVLSVLSLSGDERKIFAIRTLG